MIIRIVLLLLLGAYWLTSLRSKRPTAAMLAFKSWLLDSVAASKAEGMSA